MMLKCLMNKITNIIKLGRVTRSLPDSGAYAKGQVEYQEKLKDVGFVFPYGIHGIPPINSFILLNNIKSSEENQAGIPYKPDIRPLLKAEGEFVTGNFVVGSIITFDKDGNISITGKKDVTITVDNDMNIAVTGNANLTVTGDVSATVTGNLTGTINGTTTLTSTGTAIWNVPAGLTLSGTVTITTDAIIGGRSFLTHIHSGVTPGVGTSGPVV